MSEQESVPVVPVASDGSTKLTEDVREFLGIEAPGFVRFVRTEDGEVLVRPVESATQLRGVLGGRTAEDGRTALDLLREERAQTDDRDE